MRYENLTEQEQREVRMYGVTEAGMREAVESSSGFRFCPHCACQAGPFMSQIS